MKTLTEYGISDGEWLKYESILCGAVGSIDYPHMTSLALYINELTFSYFNQWQFVMDAYQELDHLIKHLNTLPTDHTASEFFSPYDLQAISIESKCRDYAYLMVTSIKTLFDLFACLVDVAVNRELRPEHQLPDIKSIIRRLTGQAYQPVLKAMEQFLDQHAYSWLDRVCTFRNRLIHRGYTLKPSFGFTKSDDLTVKIYKGNFAEEEQFEIGKLFEEFVADLPKMEAIIASAFNKCIPELSGGPGVEIYYKSGGGVREYLTKGVKEI